MDRERPPPDPERQFVTTIALSGSTARKNDTLVMFFRGVAPFLPFWSQYSKARLGRCFKPVGAADRFL